METPEILTLKINPRCQLEKIVSKPGNGRANIENIKLAKSERFGDVAVATNGRALVIAPVEISAGENDEGLISPEALKAARKNKPLEGILMVNGKLELPCSTAYPRPVEGGESGCGFYVKWEQVVPEPSSPVDFTVSLNPQLLLDLAQAIGCAKDGCVTLEFRQGMNPFRVTQNRLKAVGYMMPSTP